MEFWVLSILVGAGLCYPSTWVQKIAENQVNVRRDDVIFKKEDDEFSELDLYFKGNLPGSKAENYTKSIIPFTTTFSEKNSTEPSVQNISSSTSQSPLSVATSNIDPVAQRNKHIFNETRNPRQEVVDSDEIASQEDGSSEEEEGGNMLTGLLSAFLSGFSKPDGGIDLEAILGLLGSLSTQNPDGSYDFSGLTELLRSFFGDGGGSDIGAFVGGLAGAVIKGVANPPGAKGAGILAGKVVTGVLPALSGPAPTDNNATNLWQKEPQLDSGSFLTGFLKTALGSGGNGMGQGNRNSKYTLFKLLFSAITGVFSAASSLSSKSDWN